MARITNIVHAGCSMQSKSFYCVLKLANPDRQLVPANKDNNWNKHEFTQRSTTICLVHFNLVLKHLKYFWRNDQKCLHHIICLLAKDTVLPTKVRSLSCFWGLPISIEATLFWKHNFYAKISRKTDASAAFTQLGLSAKKIWSIL